MPSSSVICHNCGHSMVPRTTYRRRLIGYAPATNHCPFCLSENWHGNAPTLGDRLLYLAGLGLGGLTYVLVHAFLFKIQWWLGIEDKYPLLSLATVGVAIYAGQRFYRWFVDL